MAGPYVLMATVAVMLLLAAVAIRPIAALDDNPINEVLE